MAVEPVRAMALDATANEIVQAMNFARSEAARMGTPRVVDIDIANKVVKVYQLRYGSSTPVIDTANPVLHPLDKAIYSETISGLPFLSISMTVTAVFKFANGSTSSTIAFANDGTPCTVIGPVSSTVSELSAPTPITPQVTLTSNNLKRTITVEPVTGRVTLQ